MTLFKQIYALLFGLLLLVMLCLVFFQFSQTRNFMNNQMTSDLNNTSTSLGLILQPHLETGDQIGAKKLISVISKGGFYRQVTLTWHTDNQQHIWRNSVTIHGVPQWFGALELFGDLTKTITISSGQVQLATLKVEAHPALAYQELWRIMSMALIVLAILLVLVIVILHVRLKQILMPLYRISEYAKAIAKQKFTQQLIMPKTTELKEVVTAINTISDQLKNVFVTLDDEVNKLKLINLTDRVSGLPNRQHLSGQITSWLADPGYGGLILAKFDWLDEIHSKYGYQVRDETIKVLSKRLQSELLAQADCVIARIANTEFAFLVTKGDRHQLETYLQSLIRLINQEMSKAGCEPNQGFALGVSERALGTTLADILSQSDNALQQAIQEHRISHWFDAQRQQQKYSKEQWREILVTAISQKQFLLQWQPISHIDSNEVIQREIYCHLNIEGERISASQFVPYIELFSLGHNLDQCLLEIIVQQNVVKMCYEPLAINLTHDSINNPQFHQWLAKFLRKLPQAHALHFELPESAVNSSLSQCQILCEVIRDNGAKFGIDHCGRQMDSLTYLQQLKPHYVKLDQAFAFYERSEHNNELCRALINVLKGLNIEVIATAIEDSDQLTNFQSLRVDGVQGFIAPPQDISTIVV